MKIGIVGSGNIGGALGVLWTKAGHEVLYSSRHPEKLEALAKRSGPRARAGSVEDAARFGDVILLAVPYGALPMLGPQLAPLLRGKLVLDACNPHPRRDGEAASAVLASGLGAGAGTARYLPGARLVRAFNTVWSRTLEKGAHRAGDQVGIPLASDEVEALDQAAQLVRDAGFDPVRVGPLTAATRFDVGSRVYNTGMSGAEVRRVLALE
jgi:8-hydroxy-5-deazaflavin:NADPH oxidoreductase